MEFVYLVRPSFDRRFLANADAHQRRVFDEHGTWLERRYAEGTVRFAGRCFDGPFGLVVLEAEDEEHARRIMQDDPSVRASVQAAELYPFRTFASRAVAPDGSSR